MSNFVKIPFINEYVLTLIDIGLLAFILYKLYKLLEETGAIQRLRGVMMLGLVYAFAWIFQLSTLLWVLQLIVPGLFIGVAIMFQPELRSIVSRIGQRDIIPGRTRQKPFQVDMVLNAVEILAENRRGALVVFSRKVGLKDIMDTGTKLNADISSALLIAIFGYDGPLHDGAVLIKDGRIVTAGCFLPLSNQADIRRSFGTRHRAALGLAEGTDALVLVISEESGALSLAYDSNIFYDLGVEEVRQRLNTLLNTAVLDTTQQVVS